MNFSWHCLVSSHLISSKYNQFAMAEALRHSPNVNRYFCHSCSNTTSSLGQNLTCPECQSEFIEEMDSCNSSGRSNRRNERTSATSTDPLFMLTNSLRTFSDFRRDAEMNSFPFSLNLDEMDGLPRDPDLFMDWENTTGGGAARNRATNRVPDVVPPSTSSTSSSSTSTSQPQQNNNSTARQRYNLRLRRNRPTAQTTTATNSNNTRDRERRTFGGILSLLGLLEMSDGMQATDNDSPDHVNFVFDSFPHDEDGSGLNVDFRRFDTIIGTLLGQLERTNSGAPPAEATTIRRLPQVNITSDDLRNEKDCPVCMERFKLDESAKLLPCKHLFHNLCIDQWLKLHNTCPVCRKNVEINPRNCSNAGSSSTTTSTHQLRSRTRAPQPMNIDDEIIDLTVTDDP